MMEPIQTALKKWMKDQKDFQKRHAKIKNEVLKDPLIQSILSEHPELKDEDLNRHLIQLYEYTSQSIQCNKCQSFEQCQNLLKGYSPLLEIEGRTVHLRYEKCPKRIQYEKEQKRNRLIQSLHMPKEILNASIGNLYNKPERSEALKEIFKFLQEAKESLPKKGLYIHGSFGVGKTYLLGALANKLKEYNISSMLIYMPEFVREIRDSLKDDTVNEKMNYFKTADVLMLDDIGAETLSAWFRDEILGSILQYRMMENLPVFFTSNYNFEQLEQHLALTSKGGIEKVKAGRIMERIQQVSKEVPLIGENLRSDS